jgi:hypothetical protein
MRVDNSTGKGTSSMDKFSSKFHRVHMENSLGGYKGGYKDGLQPKSLADGNWLVKQNQPVSKIET